MPYRSERERAGFCSVKLRSNQLYFLELADYDSLVLAIQHGRTWFTGTDLYGDEVVLRVEAIEFVSRASPAAIAAFDEDEDAREEYARIHGSGGPE